MDGTGKLPGESASGSRDGVESIDIERAENEGDSLQESLVIVDFSVSSGGLSKRSSAVFPVVSMKLSSWNLLLPMNILLNSSTWFPRATFLDSRTVLWRLGTGIAVAFRMEAIEVGTERSREAVEGERRPDLVFRGVLGSLAGKFVGAVVIRDARFGGMMTGLVCMADRSSLSGSSSPEPMFCTGNDSVAGWGAGAFSPCWRDILEEGAELKRNALGTIMFTSQGHSTVVK